MSDDPAAIAALRAGSAPWVVVGHLRDDVAGTRLELSDDDHHHLVRVTRRRDGDAVVLTDGAGRCAPGTLHGQDVEVTDLHVQDPPNLSLRIVQGLGTRSKHDEVVRMLTEVGVDHITAVTTHRCQVDLSHKVGKVMRRWQAIAASACGQARRVHDPVLDGPVDLAHAITDDEVVLVADPAARRGPLEGLQHALAEHDRGSEPVRVTGVVGPEGGLTDDEVTDLQQAGGVAVSLGASVLRTEHAGLVLAGVVAAGLGRMGGARS